MPLEEAIAGMGRALHAVRLEVPAGVADDLADRWHELLDALGFAVLVAVDETAAG